MALETGTAVSDLVETNPAGGDGRSQGDDHLRLIKTVLKNTFPGFSGAFRRMTAKSANYTPVLTDNQTVIRADAAISLLLGDATSLPNGYGFLIWANNGAVTIDAFGTQTVNGTGIRVLSQGAFDYLWTDGQNWFLQLADRLLDKPTLQAPVIQGAATYQDALAIVATGDATKKFTFDVSGVTAGQTRTMTVPDKDFTPSGQGRQTIWIPASALIPRLTNGPSVGIAEVGTNKFMIRTLDFDQGTAEYAQFQIAMPKSWDKGDVTAQFEWSTSSTGNVVWGIKGRAISDAELLDAAWGAVTTVTDTGSVANFKYRSGETAAMVLGVSGALEKTDTLAIEISREAADGADTLGLDARLHGVMLYYSTDDINDA